MRQTDWDRINDELIAEIDHFTLALFGPTGAGKSTLINAVFGPDTVEVGRGRPGTAEAGLVDQDHPQLRIWDTRGFELGEGTAETTRKLRDFIEKNRRSAIDEHIDAAWYCIATHGRKITDGDLAIISTLAELKVPVLLVATQCPPEERREEDDVEFLEELDRLKIPSVDGAVHCVYAEPNEFDEIPSYGLNELVEATIKVCPDGAREALIASQQIDRESKRRKAETAVKFQSKRLSTWSEDVVEAWAKMLVRVSRTYGFGGEETKAILERSKYFEECRHVANFDPWWLSFPVIGWLAFGYRTYHLDDMTEAVGYAWVSACDQQWRPEQAGGPHWDRKAMATKFDRELKRRLPDHMS